MLRRIVRHAEFQAFLGSADSFRVPHFFVPCRKDEAGTFAYGITITARTGNAVKRNLFKRRIKAWFYEHRDNLPGGVKINLIARSGACEMEWPELCTELAQLLVLLNRSSEN